ncbi:MAG: sigma-70 family RNA polymerase sigma factor [Prolixibacteraceae bacterium]
MRQLKITQQITQRTGDSVNRYFQEVSKYPMVSPEEETELTIRIKKGDQAALEKLVVANLRFVISVAKQYQNQGLSFSDLINEGNIGLVKAARKFDETRGFKFISYAVWWIRQSITQAISENTRVVRLPLNRQSAINKVKKAANFLEQKYEREPSDEEIAEHLELPMEEVNYIKSIKKHQVSFDQPLSPGDDSDFSLYDVVHTESLLAPDNEVMHESVATNIQRALKKLSEREADVLTLSFGLNRHQPYSLHDIAQKYDISSERVRQIKSNGLSKLKNLLKEKHTFLEQ